MSCLCLWLSSIPPLDLVDHVIVLAAEVVAMLEAFGPDKLLANLGEGLGGKEDQGLVDFFVNDIHATSEKMISG